MRLSPGAPDPPDVPALSAIAHGDPEPEGNGATGDTDRETAAHLALDQPVVGDAAVNVYLLADVDAAVGAGAGDDVRVRETHERVAGTTFL